MLFFRRLSPPLFSILAAFFFSAAAQAQTTNLITVCSEANLRAALLEGGIYRFECGTNVSPVTLTNPLVAARDITLVSTGEVLLNGQNLTRLLVVQPGVRATLQKFLFFNGRQTATNLNHAGITAAAGAGIYNDGGIVTILDGRFEGSTAAGSSGSAGAAGSGDDGGPGGDASGAAIYNQGGQIFLSNTVFIANAASAGAGGVGGAGRTGGSGGDGGNGGSAAGGAIFSNNGRVVAYTSTFTNNTASAALAGLQGVGSGVLGFPGQPGSPGSALGGAIAGLGADITIYASSFLSNRVLAPNGADGPVGFARDPGSRGRDGGLAAGGAVYTTGALSATNSTFWNNLVASGTGGAGGAGGSGGFGNDGGDGGNGGQATGGAIEALGAARLIHCTLLDNRAVPGSGGAAGAATGLGDAGRAGDLGTGGGGALFSRNLPAALANSIFAGAGVTLEGAVTDLGGNIATDFNPLLNPALSFTNTNPILRALANNGGPTATLAPDPASRAVDRALAAFCPPIDQRATNRLGLCDIGAYEIVPSIPAIPNGILASFTITRLAPNILLQWPIGYPIITLQTAPILPAPPASWSTVTNPSVVVGTNNRVTLPAAAARAYFRLIAPTNQSSLIGQFPPFPL